MLVAETEQGSKEFGIPVPKQEKILPFRRQVIDQPDPAELDAEPEADDPYTRAWWQKEHAERRIIEILETLEQMKQAESPDRQVAVLETAYLHEVNLREVALAKISQG